MRIDLEQRANVTVVRLGGEFDFHDVHSAEGTIGAYIDQGAQRLVFDLAELRFISSGGIGYFIQTAKRLRRLGGELVLAGPPASFGWIAQTLGIDRMMKIFPGQREAVEYFQPRPAALDGPAQTPP